MTNIMPSHGKISIEPGIRELFFKFMYDDLRREGIARFVDNGGIVDHQCLNFLFIACNYKNYVPKYFQ
jgi:hypothetical protein